MNLAARARCFRALVWVLVALVPLQGIAAGVFATLGPAHTHLAVAVAQVQLEDVRRIPVRKMPRTVHVAGAFGHFHALAGPARHHHARGDGTVVLVAGDAANQIGDADQSSASFAFAALAPMLPCAVVWLAPAATDAMVASDAWAVLTHDPEPLERPPRRA